MPPTLPDRLHEVLEAAGCDPSEVMKHCAQERIGQQFSLPLPAL